MAEVFTPQLSHVGILVRNMELMCNFYTTIFGLRITDKGRGRRFNNDLVFLSADPGQHHQLVLSSGRPVEATFSTVMQLSFKVDTLDDLREARRRALDKGATKMRGLNHGNAISIYFRDPEGNRIEVFLDTPWYCEQPLREPIDLTQSDEAIMEHAHAIAKSRPKYQPRAQWQAEMAKRMGYVTQ